MEVIFRYIFGLGLCTIGAATLYMAYYHVILNKALFLLIFALIVFDAFIVHKYSSRPSVRYEFQIYIVTTMFSLIISYIFMKINIHNRDFLYADDMKLLFNIVLLLIGLIYLVTKIQPLIYKE